MNKNEMIKEMEKLEKRMVDTEHDSIEWSKLFVWIGLICGCTWFWYSIFVNGFFVTTMWTMVFVAIVGIWLRMSGRA